MKLRREDIWKRKETRALLDDPEYVQKSEVFRQTIFNAYGFSPEAQELIAAKSRIVVNDFSNKSGGGGWHPPGSFDDDPRGLVQLFGIQHEAALHELSHVWWHFKRTEDLARVRILVEGIVAMGTGVVRHPIAEVYVQGSDGWSGMFVDKGNHSNSIHPPMFNQEGKYVGPPSLRKYAPENILAITEEELENRVAEGLGASFINDWEIFAGFSSYAMGDLEKIPELIRPVLALLFSGLSKPEVKLIEDPLTKGPAGDKSAKKEIGIPETDPELVPDPKPEPEPESAPDPAPPIDKGRKEVPDPVAEDPVVPSPVPEMPPQETDPDVLPQKPKEPTGPSGEIKRPLGAGHGCAFMVVLSKFFALVGKLLH